MSGGAEGNLLFRHGRVRHLRIVGSDESGYVHQHRCFGRVPCRRTYFHDPLVKCGSDVCVLSSRSPSACRNAHFGKMRRLVVQNDVEQRAVYLETAIVMNETQFPEPVHKKTDSRTSRAYHLGQGLLTDLGNYRLGYTFLAKTGEQQKDPGQPFFARIEKLI